MYSPKNAKFAPSHARLEEMQDLKKDLKKATQD